MSWRCDLNWTFQTARKPLYFPQYMCSDYKSGGIMYGRSFTIQKHHGTGDQCHKVYTNKTEKYFYQTKPGGLCDRFTGICLVQITRTQMKARSVAEIGLSQKCRVLSHCLEHLFAKGAYYQAWYMCGRVYTFGRLTWMCPSDIVSLFSPVFLISHQ